MALCWGPFPFSHQPHKLKNGSTVALASWALTRTQPDLGRISLCTLGSLRSCRCRHSSQGGLVIRKEGILLTKLFPL